MTEFWDRMRTRFGPVYADSVVRDQVIHGLGNRTAHDALAAGEDPKVVWTLCPVRASNRATTRGRTGCRSDAAAIVMIASMKCTVTSDYSRIDRA